MVKFFCACTNGVASIQTAWSSKIAKTMLGEVLTICAVKWTASCICSSPKLLGFTLFVTFKISTLFVFFLKYLTRPETRCSNSHGQWNVSFFSPNEVLKLYFDLCVEIWMLLELSEVVVFECHFAPYRFTFTWFEPCYEIHPCLKICMHLWHFPVRVTLICLHVTKYLLLCIKCLF